MRHRRLLYVLVPMITGCLAYAPTIRGAFLWDDTNFLQRWILGGTTLREILFPDPNLLGNSYYHPFTAGVAYLLWLLFGRNPVGWHAANLLFHAGTAAGLFFLLRWFVSTEVASRETGRAIEERATVACMIGATVWATWPATSEAVAWISARGEQQMAFLLVWAVVLHLRARDAGTTSLPAALLFWAAMLSKEVGVVFLPLAIAATVLLPPLPGAAVTGRKAALASALWLPHVLALVVYAAMRRFAMGSAPSEGSLVRIAIERLQESSITTVFAAWSFYVREAMLLGPGAPYHEDAPAVASVAVFGALGIALGVAALVASRRARNRPWTMAALWFVVCLGPPLAVVSKPLSVTAVSMRYLYCPAMSVAFVAALVAMRSFGAALAPRRALPALAVWVTLMAFPIRTRVAPWMSAEALWTRATRDLPDRTLPHANLGLEYLDHNRLDDAERELRYAAYVARSQGEPQRHMAFCRLAEIYLYRRKLDLARTAMREASRLAGSSEGTANAITIVAALNLLSGIREDGPGRVLVPRERLKRIASALEQALALDRYDMTSRLVLALVNEALDEPMRARALYAEMVTLALTNGPMRERAESRMYALDAAIRDEPDPFRKLIFEAQSHEHAGRDEDAIDAYRRALDLSPDRLEALVPLAHLEFLRHRPEAAIAHASRAAELAPDNASLWFNLGLYRFHSRDSEGAQAAFEKATELQPDWAKPWFHLGRTLELRSDPSGALRCYRAFVARFDGVRQTRELAEARIAALEKKAQGPENVPPRGGD